MLHLRQTHGPIELFIRRARGRTANEAGAVALLLTVKNMWRSAGEGDEVLVQDSGMLKKETKSLLSFSD